METSNVTPKFSLFDNILLHVTILFIVLNIFFQFISSRLATEDVNDQLKDLIDQMVTKETVQKLQKLIDNKSDPVAVSKQLQSIFKIDILNPMEVAILENLTNYIVKKETVEIKGLFEKLSNNFNNFPDRLRQTNNSYIFKLTNTIMISLILISLVVNILPKIIANKNTGVKHLGIELLITFGFVAIIEYWFFKNVGLKYIPVLANDTIDAFKAKMVDLLQDQLTPVPA